MGQNEHLQHMHTNLSAYFTYFGFVYTYMTARIVYWCMFPRMSTHDTSHVLPKGQSKSKSREMIVDNGTKQLQDEELYKLQVAEQVMVHLVQYVLEFATYET